MRLDWASLLEILRQSHRVVLTSHILEVVEKLCPQIAIIDEGRIIEHDRMATVLRKLHSEVFVLNPRQPLAVAPTP
jgi:ABC-2 type transport system ATP-binding protein